MDWWRQAFGAQYLEVYAHRDERQAAAEIAGLLPILGGLPGPVLDCGCGAGRHLAVLREAGIPAFGLDFSADLLAAAGRRPACAGRLLRGDMRLPPLAPGSLGGVVMLFTAFAYFDDAANAACFARLAGLLAPGGVLLLDQPDPGFVRAHLQAASERRLEDGRMLRETRWLEGGRVKKLVSLEGQEPYVESVRLYAAEELDGMAAAAGLTQRAGPPPAWDARRCLRVYARA